MFLEISLNNLQLCKMKYNLVSPNDIFYQKDFVLYHIKALLLMPLTNFCSMLSSVIRGTWYINWTSISAAIYSLLCSYSYVCVVFLPFAVMQNICEKELKSIYMYTWIDHRYLSLYYVPLKNILLIRRHCPWKAAK